MSARLIQVIQVDEPRGDGMSTPFRRVTAYYSVDGKRLAEYDPCDTPAYVRLGFPPPEVL